MQTINATNSMLLGAMRRMLERNEISLEQYATSLRRSFLNTTKTLQGASPSSQPPASVPLPEEEGTMQICPKCQTGYLLRSRFPKKSSHRNNGISFEKYNKSWHKDDRIKGYQIIFPPLKEVEDFKKILKEEGVDYVG